MKIEILNKSYLHICRRIRGDLEVLRMHRTVLVYKYNGSYYWVLLLTVCNNSLLCLIASIMTLYKVVGLRMVFRQFLTTSWWDLQ